MSKIRIELQALFLYLTQKHDAVLEWFVPEDEPATSERSTHYANLLYVWFLSLFCVPFFMIRFAYLGMTSVVIVLSFGSFLMLGAPLIYKKTGSLVVARELFIFGLYALNLSEFFYFQGPISSGLWLCSLPLIAVLLGGVKSSLVWMVIDIITILGFHLSSGNNLIFIDKAHPFWYQIYIESYLGLIVALTTFMALGEVSRRSAFGKLKQAHEKINEIAIRDALTGIYNRRYIWDEMTGSERRSQGGDATFSVCLIDLDKFKNINDTHGHAMGDAVLKHVAAYMQSRTRKDDVCARFGGEEFLCLLNNTTKDKAFIFADNLRRNISELVIDGIHVSISVGVAEYEHTESFDKTIARADGALYKAKETGRNRVVIG
jgi:diguanylate cyclase (GGDEF)-like protein